MTAPRRPPDSALAELLWAAQREWMSGEVEQAAITLDRASERSLGLDDEGSGMLAVALARADYYIETGQLGEAASALKWAWEHPTAQDNPLVLADIHVAFGRIGLLSDDRKAAADCFESARDAYEEQGESHDAEQAARYLDHALGRHDDQDRGVQRPRGPWRRSRA